mmetsp:Transcript_42560/g.85405  ORF Transcript_42560/g.85405 Transcript_42560/m.85405 type:complete len:281 (-) Transcript_42560:310-1152(-)
MSLLPRGGLRSDTALNVYGCAVCHFSERREAEQIAAAATAAFHVRLPGSQGAQLGILLQQLLANSKFQHDLLSKGQMTVDDSSGGIEVSIHCVMSVDGLCIVACTRTDYPQRVAFPSSTQTSPSLIGELSRVASAELGVEVFSTGAGMGGTVRKVQLAPKVVQSLERVCADFENPGAHDTVSRVQAEVDSVHGIMQSNIEQMLTNQEQLTSLQGKTSNIANVSKGFYRDARSARRSIQCSEYKMRIIAAAIIGILILFLFRGFIFGGSDDDDVSPPPPAP